MSKICCQIAVKVRNATNTNSLKPLVVVLEQSRGSSKLFGMPKGGFGRIRHLASSETALFLAPRPCYIPSNAR
jgi:hypothetical protein